MQKREEERERSEKEEKEGAGKSGKGRWGKEMEEGKRSMREGEIKDILILSYLQRVEKFFLSASLITLLPLITRAARLVCQPEKHQQWCEKIIIMKYNLSFALCSVRLVPFCNPLPSSCAFPAESQFYFLAFTFSLPLFLFKLALYFPLPRNFFLRRVFCAAFIRFPFFFPLTVLFMLPVFQLSYFILFCTTSLYILPPFAALCLYYSNQIPITSFYQRCQPSRRHYFHVMKLAYNPFKAVKPRLNINTPHYWPSTYTTLLCQFSVPESTYCSKRGNYKWERGKKSAPINMSTRGQKLFMFKGHDVSTMNVLHVHSLIQLTHCAGPYL